MRGIFFIMLLLVLCPGSAFAQHQQSAPIFHVHQAHKKVIAFTFDDGPDPRNTIELLRVLKKEQVRATFFVLGTRARKNPDILKLIACDGHEIGNHGYSHRQFRKLTAKEVSWELKSTERIIVGVTGQKTTSFRSPYGQITPTIKQEAFRQGYNFVEWSIDPRDWQRKNAVSIAHSVESIVQAGDIVLFHDGGRNGRETVKAVDLLIKHLKAKGFTFVTVTELTKWI